MLTFHRQVWAPTPPEAVFDYLADFRTTTEWDPRARRTVRLDGDGTVGSTSSCEVAFLRRRVGMTYRITELRRPEVIAWAGESRWVDAHDLILVRPGKSPDGGTVLDYVASFHYRTAPWVLDRLLMGRVRSLCDEARAGLERTLAARAAA